MSAIVVDASVGVKWFLPEIHSAEARLWRNGPDELHVPTFFWDLEIANILWKKIRRAEITRADADLILGHLPALPLARHPEAVRQDAVSLTFGDDPASEYGYVHLTVIPEEPLVIGYCCGQHQDEAALLVQRFASALGYELSLE